MPHEAGEQVRPPRGPITKREIHGSVTSLMRTRSRKSEERYEVSTGAAERGSDGPSAPLREGDMGYDTGLPLDI